MKLTHGYTRIEENAYVMKGPGLPVGMPVIETLGPIHGISGALNVRVIRIVRNSKQNLKKKNGDTSLFSTCSQNKMCKLSTLDSSEDRSNSKVNNLFSSNTLLSHIAGQFLDVCLFLLRGK